MMQVLKGEFIEEEQDDFSQSQKTQSQKTNENLKQRRKSKLLPQRTVDDLLVKSLNKNISLPPKLTVDKASSK